MFTRLHIQGLWKAIQENWAADVLVKLHENGLLPKAFPELAQTVDVDGGPYHAETVFEHLIGALRAADDYPPLLRLAVLLHDIGKPVVCVVQDDQVSFHKHEIEGARIAFDICKRIELQPSETQYVVKMVRHHMFQFQSPKQFKKCKQCGWTSSRIDVKMSKNNSFYSDSCPCCHSQELHTVAIPGSTDKSICKWLFKVGKDDWPDLFDLRIADRKGNLAKKDKPAITSKMKELSFRIEKLIETVPAIFQEDIVLSEKEIRELVHEDTNITEVYSSLIGIVCNEPTRNDKEWLTVHLRKVYG